MNWVDLVIFIIIALSAGFSLMRGFVQEAISLTGWVVAVWASLGFCDELASLFESFITSPSLRISVAFVLVLVGILIVSAMLNIVASHMVKKTGLNNTDRMLGVAFGAVRGGVIVAFLVLISGLTSLPQETWWDGSLLLVYFQKAAMWGHGFLPPEIAGAIKY
jgi:membrane protein required for colicin V production